ncbi:MAG: DUF5615 family PIN-like protein [bacterium]
MPKFIIDEDLPRSLGWSLKDYGYDVLDIRDYGLRGAKDEKIYDFAQKEKAIILTGDAGFGNILQFPLGKHHGIVIASFPNQMPTSQINILLLEQLRELSDDDYKGNLILIEPGKIRIRRAIKTSIL